MRSVKFHPPHPKAHKSMGNFVNKTVNYADEATLEHVPETTTYWRTADPDTDENRR